MALGRGSFYFFDSFLIAGLQTVVPQLFFLGQAGAGAKTWLGACLLVGAAAMLAGIQSSRRWSLEAVYHRWPRSRPYWLGVPVLLGSGLVALFSLKSPPVYLGCYAAVAFMQAYLFNAVDNAWLKTLPIERLKAQGTTAIVAQAAGTVAGPLFFTLGTGIWTVRGLGAAGALVTGGALWGLLRTGGLQALRPDPSAPASGNLAPADRWFLVYGLMVYAATVVLTANVIPILRNDYRVPDARRAAALVLAGSNLVGAGAVLGYFLLPLLVKRRTGSLRVQRPLGHGFPARAHQLIVTALLAGSVLLYLRISVSLPYVLVIGSVFGVSFGFFRLLAREYASRRVALYGKAGLLTSFNNLHSLAQILGFLAVNALTWVHRLVSGSLDQTFILAVGGFTLLGGTALVGLRRGLRHEAVPDHPLLWSAVAAPAAE